MGPLRIILLAVLLYIGYRLIIANFRKTKSSDDESSRKKSDGSITDVLVEDPTCHKLVPREQAIKTEIDGTTYYFCSRECCDKFTADHKEEN